MQRFKKDVETASNGTLVIEVFDNQQLGGAQENVTQTRGRARSDCTSVSTIRKPYFPIESIGRMPTAL